MQALLSQPVLQYLSGAFSDLGYEAYNLSGGRGDAEGEGGWPGPGFLS